jgi:hypothetical protein
MIPREKREQLPQVGVRYAIPRDVKVEDVTGALELGHARYPFDPIKERCLVSP